MRRSLLVIAMTHGLNARTEVFRLAEGGSRMPTGKKKILHHLQMNAHLVSEEQDSSQ